MLARLDKGSKRSKQYQIDFHRGQNSQGWFHTYANIIRGEKALCSVISDSDIMLDIIMALMIEEN